MNGYAGATQFSQQCDALYRKGGADCFGSRGGGKRPFHNLTISDTGSGIHPDDVRHIFDRFYRADKARSRGSGASGLGLAIARSIVEAHQATISVQSKPQKGTTFTITIPSKMDE